MFFLSPPPLIFFTGMWDIEAKEKTLSEPRQYLIRAFHCRLFRFLHVGNPLFPFGMRQHIYLEAGRGVTFLECPGGILAISKNPKCRYTHTYISKEAKDMPRTPRFIESIIRGAMWRKRRKYHRGFFFRFAKKIPLTWTSPPSAVTRNDTVFNCGRHKKYFHARFFY